MDYHVVPLTITDLPAYKQMRLEALQLCPAFYGNSYEFEAAMSDEQWIERLSNPERCCFGLYYQQQIIGITAIFIEAGKEYITQSYIRAQHRGKKLSRLLYEARIQWAREKRLSTLEIGHRASNLISKAANQRFGFQYSHCTPRTWPDGTTEDMMYYFLKLT